MKKYANKLIIIFLILIFLALMMIFLYYKKSLIRTFHPINEYIEEKKDENEALIEKKNSIEGQYDHKEYQNKIDEIAKKYGVVGLSVALIDDGKVIDTFSYGSAIKGKLPMTEDTKIRIASISKIFIGIATMISVENGTMSLDEDISTYWKFKLKTHSKEDVITPRSILTHTSSLYDTENVSATYYNNMASRLKSGTGIRNITSGNIKNYCYNNYAIDVLGMTVELANNKSIDDILSERIYDNLGIDASFFGDNLKDKSNIATIYKSDGSVGLASSRIASWHKGKPGSVGWAFCRRNNNQCKGFGKDYSFNLK